MTHNSRDALAARRQNLRAHDDTLPAGYRAELAAESQRCAALPAVAGNGGRRRVLLIGGAGYIGSVVGEYLLRQGYQVRSLDIFLYPTQSCALAFQSHPDYQFVYGDLADGDTVDAALDGCTDVVVLAGLVGDPITKKYPESSELINERGIGDLFRRFDGRGLNKALFISTCSNYGLIGDDQLADENFELKPLSLYAKAKVAMEQALLAGARHADYCPTVLRFATAFGLSPRTRFDLTVNEFTRELYLGRELLVFDAHTWRPYCHVRDFARLIQRVLEAPRQRVHGEVFNAGGEINNCTKQMLIDKILSRLPDAGVRYQEHGPDPRNYRVDFGKVRDRLFFEPAYTVDDGIDELLTALSQRLFAGADENRDFYGNYHIDYPPRA